MPVHLKENWRKSPSWYQTSWSSMPNLDNRGGRDWEERATSSFAADAAFSMSVRVERAESGVGKKCQMQYKDLNVTYGAFVKLGQEKF